MAPEVQHAGVVTVILAWGADGLGVAEGLAAVGLVLAIRAIRALLGIGHRSKFSPWAWAALLAAAIHKLPWDT